jgi:hypothetical protein
LLWFGLLIALGSPGSFNLDLQNKGLDGKESSVMTFFENHWQAALALILVLVVVGIILFLISLVAKAGLVKSANLIAQKKETTFKSGWHSGKKYLGKLFLLAILFFIATSVVVIVLALPVAYLVAIKSWVGAVLVGILAVAIFIPLIFIFALTKTYAEFYIILGNLRLRSAVETGYNLLLKNVGNSIIFALLLVAVGIVASLVLIPVAGITVLILVPAGIAFYYLNKVVFGIYLAIAVLLFLAAILLISSIFQAYRTTAWTLFFRKIAKVEKPETIPAAEKDIAENIAPTPAAPTTPVNLQKTENIADSEKA